MKTCKNALLLLTAALLLLPLCTGCAGTSGDETVPAGENTSGSPQTEETQTPAETEADDSVLVIADGGETVFRLIRSDGADKSETDLAVALRKKCNDAASMQFSIATDWDKDTRGTGTVQNADPEVLVGRTNRAETVQVLEELGRHGYAVQIRSGKLVITATDNGLLAKAIQRFEETVLQNPERCSQGILTVRKEDCFMETVEKPLSLADVISSGEKYQVVLTQVIHAAKIDDYCIGQGAASDGTYAYFVLRTPEDGYAKIAKYSLETGKFVAASEPVYVFHGNDMTYCKSQNLLYLVHGSSEGKILTTMNPETLQVVTQSVSIPVGAGALSYSWEKDLFAVSQGGKSFYVMTPDKKLEVSKTKSATSGYTAQGMGSDEQYVYFPMSGSSDNILMTYDWNGKYICDVHLPSTLESESMFWVNDTYYVNFYTGRSGAYLYRLDVVPAVE